MGRESWGVWIKGSKRLEEERKLVEEDFKRREDRLKAQLGRFHKKTVKGKPYWYKVVGKSRWKYIGPHHGKSPTALIEEELRKLAQERTNALLKLSEAVVAKAGAHLIIDTSKKRVPEDELLDLAAVMDGVKKAMG